MAARANRPQTHRPRTYSCGCVAHTRRAFGGTIKAELSRDELASVLTDGFFPKTAVTDVPQVARRTGLAQMALPYAQDAGITRHLAAFLTRQARAMATAHDAPVKVEGKTFVHPTAVLF